MSSREGGSASGKQSAFLPRTTGSFRTRGQACTRKRVYGPSPRPSLECKLLKVHPGPGILQLCVPCPGAQHTPVLCLTRDRLGRRPGGLGVGQGERGPHPSPRPHPHTAYSRPQAPAGAAPDPSPFSHPLPAPLRLWSSGSCAPVHTRPVPSRLAGPSTVFLVTSPSPRLLATHPLGCLIDVCA